MWEIRIPIERFMQDIADPVARRVEYTRRLNALRSDLTRGVLPDWTGPWAEEASVVNVATRLRRRKP